MTSSPHHCGKDRSEANRRRESRERYPRDRHSRDDSRSRSRSRENKKHKQKDKYGNRSYSPQRLNRDTDERYRDQVDDFRNSDHRRKSRFSARDELDENGYYYDQVNEATKERNNQHRTSCISGNGVINAALMEAGNKSKRHRGDEVPSDKILWGKEGELTRTENEVKILEDSAKEVQYKPDFGLSGALAKDERTGNVVNGIVLKFTEPYEAAKPDKHWRLYVYKGDEIVDTLYIHRRSCFLFGRETKVADIPLLHPSISAQHAIIQYREIDELVVTEEGDRDVVKVVKPYLMDLKSTHGTKLNGQKIDDSRYYELRMGDLIQFGQSSRDYVLMHDKE